MDPRRYAKIVRKRLPIIAVALVLALVGAGAVTLLQPTLYQASVKLYISGQPTSSIGNTLAGAQLSQERIKSYTDQVTSTPVVQEAVVKTSIPGPYPTVTATGITDTSNLVITVTDPSPRRAAALANSLGVVFPDVIQREERPAFGGPSPITASVYQPAFVPGVPSSPHPKRNLLLGLILGILVGALGAGLAELLDTSIKSVGDVREAVDLPVLGVLANDGDATKQPLLVATRPQSPMTEAFRQLRTNLQFVDVDRAFRTLLVTSPNVGEGKSYVACNLAIALAQAGERVVLLEADMRRPSLPDYMGVEGQVGLSDVLVGQVLLDDALQQWGDGLLQVLPGGRIPPNPSELLGSKSMAAVLLALSERAEIVIIDAPPVLPVADAAVLAAATSATLLVTRAGRTRKEQLRRAAELVAGVGGRSVGAVINATATRGPDAYASAGYYATPEDQRTRSVRPAPNRSVFGRARGVRSGGPAGEQLGQGPTRPAVAVPAAAPPLLERRAVPVAAQEPGAAAEPQPAVVASPQPTSRAAAAAAAGGRGGLSMASTFEERERQRQERRERTAAQLTAIHLERESRTGTTNGARGAMAPNGRTGPPPEHVDEPAAEERVAGDA